LPFKSGSVLRFADFLATQRLAVTKWGDGEHTCSCRAKLFVVEPHSRSIVPFAISGMRFAEVTSWYLTSSFGHLELGLHRVDDPQAQLDRVADRLLLVVVVRERDRGVAVADGDEPPSLIFFGCLPAPRRELRGPEPGRQESA